MKTFLILSLLAVSASAQETIDYRFDQVRRKVVVNDGQRIERGAKAQGGDRVETGWFSYALVATERYRAKFEIFGSTEVKLAEGTPGVLVTLERGRLRAVFDKITGSEPRVVKTPGALLAVRGTEFDVTVDRNGKTTVDVFEGIVEVRSLLRPEPLLVRGGERTIYSRREPPEAGPMPRGRMREREQEQQQPPRGKDSQRPPRTERGGEPDRGRPPQQPPPQPQPRPRPPQP